MAALGEAPGVRVGARVSYRGVDVGAVEHIALTGSGVVLALRLSRPDVPLRNTDQVAVRSTGLLGDAAIAILPKSAGDGRAWAEGDTLRAAPPDSAALARQASARALVDALGRVLTRDSTDPASGGRRPR